MWPFKQLILNISLTFATLIVASSMASGSTIFNNITTPGAQNGYYIAGSNTAAFGPVTSTALAAAFTPNANYLMTSAAIGLEFNPLSSTDSNSFNLYLYSDVGGVPGVVLYQIGVNLQAPVLSSNAVPVLVTLTTPFALLANTQYWLAASPSASNSVEFWEGGGSQATPFAASRPALSTWSAVSSQTVQFAINGNAVTTAPEPNTLLCLGGGLFLLGVGRSFSRHKI